MKTPSILAIGVAALSGCATDPVYRSSSGVVSVEVASYYACPDYDPEYGELDTSNGLGCEIEQQFSSPDEPLALFHFYPSATTDPGGGIHISDSYISASDSNDPSTLAQCCANAAAMVGAGLMTASGRPATLQLLAPGANEVCNDYRKAKGDAPDRVDGVKQWELDHHNHTVNTCGDAAAGPYLALKPKEKHVVRENSTPITKVSNTTTKAALQALIAAGGLANRKYALWLASPHKKDLSLISFALANEKTPLPNDFCVVYKDGGTKYKVQAKNVAGEGHPTLAAALNANAADKKIQSIGGFWACDGGEGTEPAANSTEVDNCSGRWPPKNANVVADAKAQMNAVTTLANFWDTSAFRVPANCP
jgi:hypothetical protein